MKAIRIKNLVVCGALALTTAACGALPAPQPDIGVDSAETSEDVDDDAVEDTVEDITDTAGPDAPDAPDEADGSELPDAVADIEIPDATPVDPDASDSDTLGPDAFGPLPEITPEFCANLPKGPFGLTKLQGPMASEDLAFDRKGFVIGGNDSAIFRSPKGGPPQVWVPDLNFRAGLRFLPNGDLVVCDNTKGRIVRIDQDGAIHTVLAGLSYPNGIMVDLKGWIYFTEQSTDKVHRVHPFTGEDQIITTKVNAPNGLTFSPDYRILYIGGFSGEGVIYAVSLSEDGVPGKTVKWAENVGSGSLDGMATDACGNVYIADYGQTKIWRISPDGKEKYVIIDGSETSGAYLPNMQFGTGVGGWDPLALYLCDGWNKGIFEVYLGVPTAPRAFP